MTHPTKIMSIPPRIIVSFKIIDSEFESYKKTIRDSLKILSTLIRIFKCLLN